MIPFADVVCVYYRQMVYLPFFFWGYRRNWSSIHKFYLVNDEPWTDDEREVLAQFPEWTLLDHEHEGYGVAKSFNQGIAASDSEYIYLTSFDQILPPGIISSFRHEANTGENLFVFGGVEGIKESPLDLTMGDVREGRFTKMLWAADLNTIGKRPQYRWQEATNACALIPKRAHDKIGGFNEEFVKTGRGVEDQEYAARWQAEFGDDSIRFVPTCSLQFYRPNIGATVESMELLNATLKRLGFPPKELI